MDLSIIIVNYKTPKLLEDCLLSIKNSNIKYDYEVVVVDNGSGKDSENKIEKLKGKGLIDKNIINKQNLGFSKANNKGINISEGKYKLLLNSDTLVQKGAICPLLEFSESTKDAGVVGSKLLNNDGTVQDSCYNFPTIVRAVKQYWLNSGKPLNKFAPKTEEPVEVDAVVGASFLITPKALKKVGPLDERYFMYFEDIDFCKRVWDSGLKVYYLPSSKVIHLHGQSGKDLAPNPDQWRRLIPSSKIYHGVLKHYLFNFILWSGQKFHFN